MRAYVAGCLLGLCSLPSLSAASHPQQDAAITDHQQKAREFLSQQKPKLAIPEFQAIVAAEPDNLDAQANLGVLLYFTGKPTEAEPHLRAALALAPNQAKLQVLLGFCEHRTGQPEDARKDLTAALPNLTDPKIHRQAGLELVEIDTALNDLPAAAIVASQLKAAMPTDPEVLYASYRVYTDLAQEAMVDLSLTAPDSAQMHQAMAHELLRERDNAAAIANLRAALKADPNLPGGHFELAEALHAATEPSFKAEAEGEYKLALQQNPKDAAALTRLGDIASDREDHTSATALYKQALALQPEDEEATLGLAYQLSETGHPDEALALLEQVIENDPTNVTAHYRLSGIYRRLHRPEDAKREIAEYERLKSIKDRLHTLYQQMRLQGPQEGDAKQ